MGRGVEIHPDELHDQLQDPSELAIKESDSLEVVGGNDPSEEIKKPVLIDQKNKRHFTRRSLLTSGTTPREDSQLNYPIKRGRIGSTPSYSIMDCLPEHIIHDILSRLSIPDLLRARQSCIAWHRMVSFCHIFQQFYDSQNHQSWIALTSSSRLNPDGLLFFNTYDANQYCFLSPAQHLDGNMSKAWLLQGVTDGLMLLASREGRLGVANPLTRRFRLLPDAKVSLRLRLESCLRKNLWRDQVPSMSISIVGDLASKTFKVVVLGEMRNRQVHALIYSSVTDTWTLKLCSEIDHNLFRNLSHSTVEGNTIHCIAIDRKRTWLSPPWMVSYNTETHLSVVQNIERIEYDYYRKRLLWEQTIGVVAYKGKIFVFGVASRPVPVPIIVCLEAENPGVQELKILTTTDLDWEKSIGEVAAAYDGKHSVSIIARNGSSAILAELNLETKEWKTLDGIAAEIGSRSKSASHEDSRNKVFKAFHFNFKFCTAI